MDVIFGYNDLCLILYRQRRGNEYNPKMRGGKVV